MNKMKFGMVLLVAALAAAGCSSKGGVNGEGENADSAVIGAGGPEINKYGAGQNGGAYGAGSGGAYGAGGGDAALDDPNSPLSKRVIYFNYDSSEVAPEYVSVVNNHAAFLASNSGKTVVLEGHADERGSSEYNVALGEQRAKAVAKLLKLQGVSDSQLQIVSFGEEKPAVSGHDESAYQQNRRVELAYPGH
ncbi:peptidoglycan-associated lipoprotein Pal [Methylococcus sp. EFPC2]|uniref:peptidoglycan-associated lipoprotein Pal n=1 Tax=Methylococcus sp. EFPC2 TaxID=2812648 RepID=UPI001966E791|nr:peptidoglycan-associated lipoprotein Pal [Methylococcus sp. EFPC2]QSA95795.1 peptidoglycan-associated lipoprotein Pal [Methylococcus sp. EFPC2]